jgi:alkylhydroperoxidase family enzyme
VSRANGVTEEQLVALPAYKDSSAFSEVERLVLDYAVAMTETPVEVPDALFAALRARLDAQQIVELTAAIAWENYRARFDHAIGIGSQGFSEGAFCALPERKAAPALPPSPVRG